MATHIISVKHEFRASVPSNWQASIAQIPGIIVGDTDPSPNRIRVTINNQDAFLALKQTVGSFCHIESIIERSCSKKDDFDDIAAPAPAPSIHDIRSGLPEPVSLFRMPPKLVPEVLEKIVKKEVRPSDLKITIGLVNEPHLVVDDYVITQEEFDDSTWEADLIRIVRSAIAWERQSRKPKDTVSEVPNLRSET